MSGPIVRKYGFPNFEQIFGKREVQHGVDDEQPSPDAASLPPDLPHTGTPVDPTKPESAGTVAPSTEFGSTAE
jgi:hypothetical protein